MMALPRAAGAELMDRPDADPAELARSLADLREVNRWLGGHRVVLRHLATLLPADPAREYALLDVATGSADVPLAVLAWARRTGRRVRVTATDVHAATLAEAARRVAGHPGISVEPADALRLPYPDGAFDAAMLCTALHHFDREEDALLVLRELARVSRIGVVVSDLRRTRAALLGARLLAATRWRSHPITRHDGPLSVRRAFTAAELRGLAERAGLDDSRVHGHGPFRLALVARRPR